MISGRDSRSSVQFVGVRLGRNGKQTRTKKRKMNYPAELGELS